MKRYTAIPLSVLLIFIIACHPKGYLIESDTRTNTKVVAQANVANVLPVLQKYKDSMQVTTSRILTYSTAAMTKEKPNCTLSNLFTDAMIAFAQKQNIKADAAIANYGGIRLNAIAPGKITVGTIYELSPFENFVAIIELKGSVLRQWCNMIADKGGDPIAGITFTLHNKQAENIKVSDKILDDAATYIVCTNDYLAMGNDNCTFLKGLPYKVYTITIRDCIIDYISTHNTFIPNTIPPKPT